MAELTNSTRHIQKVTYAPIELNKERSQENDRIKGKIKRGLEKAVFMKTLEMTKEELKQIEGYIAERRDKKKKTTLLKILQASSKLISDKSSMAAILHANAFRNFRPEDLWEFVSAIVNLRRSEVDKIERYIYDEILSKAAQHSKTDENFVENVSNYYNIPKNLYEIDNTLFKGLINQALSARPSLKDDFKERFSSHISTQAMKIGASFDTIVLSVLYGSISIAEVAAQAIIYFKERFKMEPVGRLHMERLEMFPAGVERGELVYSVPLAPKETVNISHKEWAVRKEEYEKIIQDYLEGYSEEGVTEKTDISTSTDSESNHSTSFNVDSSLTASYSVVTLSLSTGYNSTSDDKQAIKDSRDHSFAVVKKSSARTRKEHKQSFKVSSVAGTEDRSVRIITNHSDNESMRIDYFQLMRKWRVDLIRYGLRMTYDIVIPSPGLELMRKINQARMIAFERDKPFQLDIMLEDITIDKLNELSRRFKVGLEKCPLLETGWLSAGRKAMPGEEGFVDEEEAKKTKVGSYKLEIAFGENLDDYEISEAQIIFSGAHHPSLAAKTNFTVTGVGVDYAPHPDKPKNSDWKIINLNNFRNVSANRLPVSYMFRGWSTFGFDVQVKLKLKSQSFEEWRMRIWNAIVDAEERSYQDRKLELEDQYKALSDEIQRLDALTLRRMEREEVVKGVLRWLVGFDGLELPVLKSTNDIYNDVRAQMRQEFVRIEDMIDNRDQTLTYLLGETIKNLHNAIEWENMLYFNYPYFWDRSEIRSSKLFLYHEDPLHQMFLRSGAARVVIPIRPGFELWFADFIEGGGILQQMGVDLPYVTIADEIQNYAKTNYPGIPPANPDSKARPLLYPEQQKTWQDMQKIIKLIAVYFDKNGKYPTNDEGIAVLQQVLQVNIEINGVTVPVNEYLGINEVPLNDYWGNPFLYSSPGLTGEYDLGSYGADGALGGDGKNADIWNNTEGSLIAEWYEYTPTSALDIELNTDMAKMA